MWDNNANNNSPWGQKPNNNDFDKALREGKNKLNKFFNNNSKFNLPYIIIGILVIWLAGGFYIVDEGEKAAVLRFGKFVRIATPGPNYHLPHPFEKIVKLSVERAEREEIGFRSIHNVNLAKAGTNQRNIPEESLMLTGDQNIVDINFIVQWKIRKIEDFVFNIEKQKETVKSVAESAMREIIGQTPIAEAQTEGRSSIEAKTKDLLQNILDSYNSGIEIINLQMLKVDPPLEVIDSFRDVQTARADKEREINQAQAYQNDVIPRARGQASKIVQEAEAFKQGVIARSIGEVSRFNAVYEQYTKAKSVTKKRIYLETMEEVLKDMDKVILNGNASKNLLPYLPVNEINKK